MSNDDNAKVDPEWAFKKSLSPQTRFLYDYLTSQGNRHITQMIALNNLGIGSLTSRVSELRKALALRDKDKPSKEVLKDETKKDFNGKRYKSYWLTTENA